jgi:hypothetical protein
VAYFSSIESKELSTINSVSSESILQETRGNNDILGQKKIKGICY